MCAKMCCFNVSGNVMARFLSVDVKGVEEFADIVEGLVFGARS